LDYAPIFENHDEVGIYTFGSDISAFDFDVVLWDPARSFRRYWVGGRDSTFNGLPAIEEDESAAIRADTARRKAEFIDFLKAGRTIVVIVSPPQRGHVRNGKYTTTGTGRNQQRIHEVAEFDLLSALPLELPAFTVARGDRLELVGDGPVAQLLRKYSSALEYTAVFEQAPEGSVIARIQGTDRILGCTIRTPEGGHLVLMPRISFTPLPGETEESESDDLEPRWFDDNDDEGPDADYERNYPDEAEQFQLDLLQAIEALTGAGEISRPAWAADYATENQRSARDKVAKETVAVERARARLAKLQAEAEEMQQLDQLFLGSGRQLELRARDVLTLLGGVVTEPEPGRADWNVNFDGHPAVIEVKGVTKSASEKNAAQLEKWVAAAYEHTGESPKGILIVNTWREKPLADRTGVDFPDQMVPYSSARNHCLVTGLQLFVIACEIERDPTRAAHWRGQLLNTSGILGGVPDWRTVIQHSLPVLDR
jgi:hypothetical protein